MFSTAIFEFKFDTHIFCLYLFCRNFTIIAPGVHNHMPNGILGLLCKLHYPGCMIIDGQLQPALSWDHYREAIDTVDRLGRAYANKAEWVLAELWVSTRG